MGSVTQRGNMAHRPQNTPTASVSQIKRCERVAVNALPIAHHPTMTVINACQDSPVMEMLRGKGAGRFRTVKGIDHAPFHEPSVECTGQEDRPEVIRARDQATAARNR